MSAQKLNAHHTGRGPIGLMTGCVVVHAQANSTLSTGEDKIAPTSVLLHVYILFYHIASYRNQAEYSVANV